MKEKEIPSKEMVEVYTRRLVDACTLLRVVETASYPLKEYSSGEHESVRLPNGAWKETDKLVSLPIFKPTKGREKGLLFGVKHTIFNTREVFVRWGCGKEADEVINNFKTMAVKKGCESDERK